MKEKNLIFDLEIVEKKDKNYHFFAYSFLISFSFSIKK